MNEERYKHQIPTISESLESLEEESLGAYKDESTEEISKVEVYDYDSYGFNEGEPEGCPDIDEDALGGANLAGSTCYKTFNDVYINKLITKVNKTIKNDISRIKFLVFHYVGAVSSARANANYFYSVNRGASAGYFVDPNEVWQVVEDKDASWHCGGGRQSNYGGSFFKVCLNSNSIGIEMCCKKSSSGVWYIEEGTLHNAAKLGYYLMKTYNIPSNHIIRHFDVTGKYCPEPMVLQKDAEWTKFKKRVLNNDNEEELTMSQIEQIMAAISNVDNKINDLNNRLGMVYAWVDDNMPDWAKPTIIKLMQKGYLKGDDEGKLQLSYDMLRILVILDRAGNFDK